MNNQNNKDDNRLHVTNQFDDRYEKPLHPAYRSNNKQQFNNNSHVDDNKFNQGDITDKLQRSIAVGGEIVKSLAGLAMWGVDGLLSVWSKISLANRYKNSRTTAIRLEEPDYHPGLIPLRYKLYAIGGYLAIGLLFGMGHLPINPFTLIIIYLVYKLVRGYLSYSYQVDNAVRKYIKLRQKENADLLIYYDKTDNAEGAENLPTSTQLMDDIGEAYLAQKEKLVQNFGLDSFIVTLHDPDQFWNDYYFEVAKSYKSSAVWEDLSLYTKQLDYFLRLGIIPQSTASENVVITNQKMYFDAKAFIGQRETNDYLTMLFESGRGQGIPAVDAMLSQLAEKAELERQKQAEEQELQQIRQLGLNEQSVNIIKTIKDNREIWGFSPWNLNGDGISGNENYLKIRVKLLGDASLNSVKAKLPLVQAKLRHSVIIKPISDRGSLELTVLLNENLDKYSMTIEQLKSYADENKVFVGKGYAGNLVTAWNNQANHAVIGGKSGSGKTVEILSLLTNLVLLKDFDYRNVIIASSSKVGDFAEYERAGAYVGAGNAEVEKVIRLVDAEAQRREKLWAEAGVANLWEYNKKNPNNQIDRIVLVLDEFENFLNSKTDKKLADAGLAEIVDLLNIARSSGINVIFGAQSVLKAQLGEVVDKVTMKIAGNATPNILNTMDSSISSYFQTASNVQGVFFSKLDNLKFEGEYIEQGNSGYVLTQTPYISDIKASNLPELTGSKWVESQLQQSNDDTNLTESISF